MKGSEIMNEKMKDALKAAFSATIAEVGIDCFKKTSLFMSNRRENTEVKMAA